MMTYVAVNTDALRHNVAQARQHLQGPARLMAVVKANAYGHGLVETARTFVAAGADWLGVSTVAEGVALREAGLTAPVLLFLPPLPDEYEPVVLHGLTPTVLSTAHVSGLGATAEKLGRDVDAHLYSDTGLSRLGSDDSLPAVLAAATVFARLRLTGIYTHFGPPGSGRILEEIDFIREGASYRAFAGLARDAIAQSGEAMPMVHVAASALFVTEPKSHLDLVRLGTVLYGQYPDHLKERPLQLRDDTFSLRSRIVAIHTVPRGSRIGYGGEFICNRETRVATVPVGTAHGLGMAPQSVAGRWQSAVKAVLRQREARRGGSRYAGTATLGAAQAPLLGRISMDQCCLDVTDLPAAAVGDEVALPARRLAVSAALPRLYAGDTTGV